MHAIDTEEHFGRLLDVVDCSAFEVTPKRLMLTTADRMLYELLLVEAENALP